MSWLFSSAPADAPTGPKLHPVTDNGSSSSQFGRLEQGDTEWLTQTSGFITETQTFYSTTADGAILMGQVIHSGVGLWYPQIQFTFRYHNPTTNQTIWKSTNVKNFVVGPNGLDRRSSKSDQFTITLNPDRPTEYKFDGKYDEEVQISWIVKQLAEGWKYGSGARGGMTYFGKLNDAAPSGEPGSPDYKAGGDGFMVHRFWPRCSFTGITRIGNQVLDMSGSRGIFIHAIQGMRPNLAACRWNFHNFQSVGESDNEKVSLTQMEFETTSDYDRQKINIGSIVIGDRLLAVVGGKGSTCTHEELKKDPQTGYDAPGRIVWDWDGKVLEKEHDIKAKVVLDLLKGGEGYETKGLIEKVDVLGEIPGVVKSVISYAAGTRPYIYQWFNQATGLVTLPASIAPGAAGDEAGEKTLEVKGYVFNEATFISE